MPLSKGGLVQMWYRLQAILFAWYEEIQQEAWKWAVLHADETGRTFARNLHFAPPA